jgi:sec-independent protein translocase protein TatB
MIDFGFDKIALIGAVALIVIGPEKLPKVARTVGHLVGKAQRYVADVRAEVNRSMELDEIRKMKSQFEDAARNVEQTVQAEVQSASQSLASDWSAITADTSPLEEPQGSAAWLPEYRHPGKKWRLKRGAKPQWYKRQQGVKTHVQSGAARVARFRPAGIKRL